MNTLNDLYDVLFYMSWRLRRVHGNFRYSRDTIRNETFEIELWNHQFQTDFTPMCRLLERYMLMRDANQNIVVTLDTYMFYWHHVIDAFARETPEWRIANIDFIQERIDHAQWLDEIIRDEMQTISERMRQNGTINN